VLRPASEWMDGDNDDDDDDDESDDAPRRLEAPLLRVELVGGPMRGHSMDVGADGATVGSSDACTLTLRNDLTVSPLHARICHVDGKWYLHDLGSRDGTHLLLADAGAVIDVGDTLRLGRTDLTFYFRPAYEPCPTCNCCTSSETACRTFECGPSQEGTLDVWRVESAAYLRENADQLSRHVLRAPRRQRFLMWALLISTAMLVAGVIVIIVFATKGDGTVRCKPLGGRHAEGHLDSYDHPAMDYSSFVPGRMRRRRARLSPSLGSIVAASDSFTGGDLAEAHLGFAEPEVNCTPAADGEHVADEFYTYDMGVGI